MEKNAKNSLCLFATIDEVICHFKKNENSNSIMNYSYYLTILNNAYSEFKNKEYENAILTLSEELETPYVPKDVEKYYHLLIKMFRQEAYEKRNQQIQNLEAKELINLAIQEFPKNIHIFDYFTTKPVGFFSKEDIDYFRFIFSAKDFKNDLKLNVLYLINEIIDFKGVKINFVNNNLNKNEKITLGKKLFKKEILDYYKNVDQEISNLLFQEPSLEDMGLSIVEKIANFYFPFSPSISIDSSLLGKTIVSYIHNLFNQKTKISLIGKSKLAFDLILRVINSE